MTTTSLVAIAAAALSLLFSYFPGLNTWYAGKPDTYKKLFQVLWLAVVSVAIYSAGCIPDLAARLPFPSVACTAAGAWDLLIMFLTAVVANQATFLLSPQAKAVRLVKTMNARLAAVTRPQ